MTETTPYTLKTFGQDNKKVVFFFAGMGTRTWLYMRPIKRLLSYGYRVHAFDFNADLVTGGDAESYLQTAEEVSNKVGSIIKDAANEGIKKYAVFGTSMGTLMAIRCAADHPEISKVILNMTYGSVAENIWTWRVVKSAKLRAIDQGYTMQSLDKKLAPISPIPNAPKLKGKQVLLYLARHDRVLRYNQSIEFKKALDKAGVEYTYVENKHFGHILSGFLNFSRYKIWRSFLDAH